MKKFVKFIIGLSFGILLLGLTTGFGQELQTFIPTKEEKRLVKMQIQFNISDSLYQTYVKNKEIEKTIVYNGSNPMVVYFLVSGKFGRVWVVEKPNSFTIIDSTTKNNIVGYPFTKRGEIVYSTLRQD